ncbi:unnamed protein product [Somion occarium]|uniref:RNA-dependent RNA polymerase n=1 Tax=Somion occarium TaxID=3059160 RepID=A0ABP1CMV2_9APHY
MFPPEEVYPLSRNDSTVSVASTQYSIDEVLVDAMQKYEEDEVTTHHVERSPAGDEDLGAKIKSGDGDDSEMYSGISDTELFNITQPAGPPITPTLTTLGKRPSDDFEGPCESTRPYKAWKASTPSPTGNSPSKVRVVDVTPAILTTEHTLTSFVTKLPWGVQWELARLGTKIFAQSTDKAMLLKVLKGLQNQPNNVAAPKVERISKLLENHIPCSRWDLDREERFASEYQKESQAKSPWHELDIEEAILKKNPLGCIGCNEEDQHILAAGADSPYWYGGKVNFAATLEKNFHLKLEKACLSSSCRLYRRFGSSKFIRVSIPDGVVYSGGDQVAQFFQQPFVIFGHVFCAFFSKDKAVFLFQTNEHYENGEISASSKGAIVDQSGCSLLDFISWHNDIEVNHNQTAAKWAARFALGLSNSVPVFQIKSKNYYKIPEVYSPFHNSNQNAKAPSNFEMTDGCGLANAAFFKVIQQRMGKDHLPTAVQCRLNGVKGLFLLHPEHTNSAVDEPTVWVRPSQTKIRYHSEVLKTPDPTLFTLDLLRIAHMSSPARLSGETIINMAENGVPFFLFLDLMKIQLEEAVHKLTFWTDSSFSDVRNLENACRLLRYNVEKDGSVPQVLLTRHNPGTARVQGFVADDAKNKDKLDTGLDDEYDIDELEGAWQEQSTAWWEDPVSGCPSSLHETVLVLLDAGFSPTTCGYLRHKLREVIQMTITRHTNKYHFDVTQSCTAFVVPDPCGVLEPGEVHIKSSVRNLVNQNGDQTDIILGDVLLTRHPCKVPTDVQKAVAVHKEKLSQYTDVIVVSVKGHKVNGEILGRHLASMTGGGDYDGDKMQAFWEPTMVFTFKPADPKFATEPASVKDCLSTNNDTVSEVLDQIPPSSGYLHQIFHLQKYLLRGLIDASLVGNYSKMWEHSIYEKGYDHEDTVHLAYLFCAILDGAKTGVTVKPEQFAKDKARFHFTKALRWKNLGIPDPQHVPVPRSKTLPPFIMDILREKVLEEKAAQNQYLDKILPPFRDDIAHNPNDVHLAKPWMDAWNGMLEDENDVDITVSLQARGQREDLEKIKSHVEQMSQEYRRTVAGPNFTKMPIQLRQNKLRELTRKFVFDLTPEHMKYYKRAPIEFGRVKASYAYVHDRKVKHGQMSQFPFSVAMRQLCAIKAEAMGGEKAVCANLAPALHCHKAWVPNV